MLSTKNKNWINAIFSFVLILLWILFFYEKTFSGMISIWIRSETFTHGFLVVPIVVWLIWQKRNEIILIQPKSDLLYIFPIIFIGFIWLLADLVSINSVTQISAIAIIVLAICTVFGSSVASIIIFPLFFLFFAVPLGEFLLPVLMAWTAKFTVIAIRLSGVPVYQEGLQFVISSGSWSVVEACSGVRYLISSLMIGTLYAYLNYTNLRKRIIFICFSIVVPIIANWMRAYFIVMLGHLSNNKLAVGFDHLIYGWLFFGVVIIFMFLIGARWADNIKISNDLPLNNMLNIGIKNTNFWHAALLLSIFITFPVVWEKFVSNRIRLDSIALVVPKELKSGWTASLDQSKIITPNFHGNSSETNIIYNKNSMQVGFFVKYYSDQNYDNKLVSSNNSIFTTQDKYWIKLESHNQLVNQSTNYFTALTSSWKGLRTPDRTEEIQMQTLQFYWVNGFFTSNDYKAKIYGAIQRLFGNGDDAAIIVLYAYDTRGNLTNQSINQFLEDNFFQIESLLKKSRSL